MRIGIIGGGAAGFFAAIQAGMNKPQSSVSILEGSGKVLSKVLVSGGGRCNVTNNTIEIQELITNYPRGTKELQGAFTRFSVKDTIGWFKQHGVRLKTEPDNRMFPLSDNSGTIANCLKQAAADCGVEVLVNHKVKEVRYEKQFEVVINDKTLNFDKLILTTGGGKSGFNLAQQLGHSVVSPVPSLFTFNIKDPLLEGLSGISFPAACVKLEIAGKKFERSGPLLITHWGLSGPAIIQLSAFAARELYNSNYFVVANVSFVGVKTTEVLKIFEGIKRDHSKKKLHNLNPFDLPKRFWEQAIKLAEISEQQNISDCSKKQLSKLAELISAAKLQVSGKGVFKEEFVTCGGVDLKEVDFRTMQSKLNPDLYFAGEVLNIDGITGGFNFQSAWTTGWIAGNNV